jgi:hypothetical protein
VASTVALPARRVAECNANCDAIVSLAYMNATSKS